MLVDLNLDPTILVFVGKEEVGEISSDSEVPIAVGELEFADSSARARPFRLRGTETKKKMLSSIRKHNFGFQRRTIKDRIWL